VDKILKGANPADLAVEEATKFDLGSDLMTSQRYLKIRDEEKIG